MQDRQDQIQNILDRAQDIRLFFENNNNGKLNGIPQQNLLAPMTNQDKPELC